MILHFLLENDHIGLEGYQLSRSRYRYVDIVRHPFPRGPPVKDCIKFEENIVSCSDGINPVQNLPPLKIVCASFYLALIQVFILL